MSSKYRQNIYIDILDIYLKYQFKSSKEMLFSSNMNILLFPLPAQSSSGWFIVIIIHLV